MKKLSVRGSVDVIKTCFIVYDNTHNVVLNINAEGLFRIKAIQIYQTLNTKRRI